MTDYYPEADFTGKTDVTAEMNAFLADLPNDATIHLQPYGLYRMEDTWAFERRSGITIEGHHATIGADTVGYKNRSHLRFRFCSNIKVRELRIVGANPDAGKYGPFLPELAAQHGVEVSASVGVELDRLTITDVYGDFVYLGWRDKIFSDWVSVHDCTFLRSGRQGISLIGARIVGIENNVIVEARRSTIDLEPHPGSQAIVVTIKGNTCYRGRLNFVAANGKGPVDYVTVEDNKLYDMALGIDVVDKDGGRRNDWVVRGNYSDLPAGSPNGAVMHFTRVDGVIVQDNIQPMKPDRNMVLADHLDCTSVVVTGNCTHNAVGQVREL